MNKILLRLLFLTTFISSLLLSSCDDGHVDDPVYNDLTERFVVKIKGIFKNRQSWTGNYSVVAACFDGESSYSVIQKVLPSNATDSTETSILISGVPTNAETVEIAIVNTLRQRIATLYSYEIPAQQNPSDTIMIDVGEINVGMFGAINQYVFQSTVLNCSRCHSEDRAASNLTLTSDKAYSNLVNVISYNDSNYLRVKPEDSENSYLYKVLTTGTDEVSYNHTTMLADYPDFLDIIKSWIDGGAKE